MRTPIALFTPLALMLIAIPAHAQMQPGGGGGGGGGGGPPGAGGPNGGPGGAPRAMRAPKPVKRAAFDKAVTALFRSADTDGDGVMTPAEVRAIIDARRAQVVSARFRRIDSDGNGAISPAEFQAWQAGLGSAVLSDPHAGGNLRDDAIVPAVIEPDLGDGDDAMVLHDLIAPLSVTLIAEANTDYDRGASLGEMLACQGARFTRADKDRDGAITMEELRPARGPGGRGDGGPPAPPQGAGSAQA